MPTNKLTVKWSTKDRNTPLGLSGWQIENLSLFPQWLDEVALWHHLEWLRNANEFDLSEESMAEKLSERVASMQSHMASHSIPSTFVAHNGHRPIGSVSLIDYPDSVEPTRVWLTNLYVDEVFQKQGVGGDLLAHAESFAKSHLMDELSLYTFDAKDYYLQRGWRWLSQAELHGRVVDVFSKCVE